MINERIGREEYEASRKFKVGDIVKWKDRMGRDIKGRVERVNIKSVKLERTHVKRDGRWEKADGYQGWSVSPSFLSFEED